jgi:hypothetical protein
MISEAHRQVSRDSAPNRLARVNDGRALIACRTGQRVRMRTIGNSQGYAPQKAITAATFSGVKIVEGPSYAP